MSIDVFVRESGRNGVMSKSPSISLAKKEMLSLISEKPSPPAMLGATVIVSCSGVIDSIKELSANAWFFCLAVASCVLVGVFGPPE